MISLTINNQNKEVETGTSILQAARQMGIEIPALCYWEGVRPMNSCRLCVVRDAKSGRLLPSCSTVAEEGMTIETESGDVCAARKEVLELIISEHVGDCEAPCSHICPASLDIPLMMRQVYAGDLDGTVSTITNGLVFPWTLGYVCPAPCQNGCRRKQYDETMQIRNTHRAVAEIALAANPEPPECPPGTGKHIAIIGGGLAGMAAAWVLRKQGHACTVYEKDSKAGGKLRDLPPEQLPIHVLDTEIDWISRMGVRFEYNREVRAEAGATESLDAILAKSDAVIVACKGGAEPGGKIFEAAEHKLAVRAVGNGKTAAQWVHRYLNALDPPSDKPRFESKIVGMRESELDTLREHNENKIAMTASPADNGLAASQQEAGRCLHCDCRKQVTCVLRKWATEYGVERRKYNTTEERDFRIIGIGGVVFEPGKCIKCGLCVEIAKNHGESLGLTFIGRGFDMEIKVPFNGTLEEGLRKSAAECVAACPTAAIAFRNKEDIETPIPRPGSSYS